MRSRRPLRRLRRKRKAVVIPMFVGTKQAVDGEHVGCNERNRDEENNN